MLSLAVAAVGVWWLMPRRGPRLAGVGLVLAMAGCGVLVGALNAPLGDPVPTVMFWVFSASAVLCGILMITSRNAVYAALWFSLVTLCTCGLFLLQSAAFLAAATVIVYAGAIVVTFVFVIMLAEQSGATAYDRRSRQSLVATVAAFILLGAVLSVVRDWGTARSAAVARQQAPPTAAAVGANVLSKSRQQPADAMHSLGRSLFSDYLFAVELAGTLLLVASIGAIAIAPRRSQGTL